MDADVGAVIRLLAGWMPSDSGGGDWLILRLVLGGATLVVLSAALVVAVVHAFVASRLAALRSSARQS